MTNHEKSIRDLLTAWHDAAVGGDLQKLLSLMDEHVVFLQPGQPPMRGREAFASSFREMIKQHRIAYTWEIVEIKVAGELAYCWNHLRVTVSPLQEGSPTLRSGFTLTIFRKNSGGSWVLFRDANLLTPE